MSNCEFDVQIHKSCKQTRDWNYLDTLFILDPEEYRSLCKLCDSEIVPPSQLMKKFEETIGKTFTVVEEGVQYTATFDFNQNYEPFFVIEDTWTEYD